MVVLLSLTMMLSASILALPGPAQQVIQGPDVEQFLRKARFVAKEPLGSGVTGSLKVTLELDGKKQFAVLKTVDQMRPGARPNASGKIEIDFQDSWKTEVAAYELDKLLGLGMVPATIQRQSPYDNKPASLQLWVEASMTEAKRREKAIIPPDPEKWSEQLANMSTFDALIYNTDRHPDNLLITDNFAVRLIDHSRSFRPNAELRNKEDLKRFSRPLLARIEQLNKSDVEKKLGDYLSLTQINGLLKRRQLLLDLVKDLEKGMGDKAVYYP
jgi:Phosphatidylinositol 3- and 4-kinase